jgi:2'-5' RNA ligase
VRLFVAVWPPKAVIQEISRLPRPDASGVRWTTTDQWHVTLRFLGEVTAPDETIDALRGASLPPANARIGDVVRRLGPNVLCVDVQGLGQLAEAVTEATATIGRPPEARTFRGHLTLGRASKRGADLRPLAGAPVAPLEFVVRSVAVVQSHLGRPGARYQTLVEVPCH